MKPSHSASLALALLAVLAAPSRAGSGGPDASGYTWTDEVAGCAPDGAFTRAHEMGFGTNEWLKGPFELGFHFPFHDRVYTQAWLHADGLVFFTPTWSGYLLQNEPIPTNDGVDEGFIAAYWDWMEAREPAGWWERAPGNEEFRVAWHGYLPFGGNDDVRYEVTLSRNGDIRIDYLDSGDGGRSATVGVESPDQTTGLEILRDGASPGGFSLAPGAPHALCIGRPSGLSCAAAAPLRCGFTSGSLTAGAPSTVDAWPCGGPATGTEKVYELRLDEPTDVAVTITPSGTRDLSLHLVAGCTEHACLDGGGRTVSQQALMAGTYRVVVDAATPADEGSFSLVTACAPLATSIACATPTPATTEGGRSLLDGYRCVWGDFAGPEAYFSVDHAGGPLFAQVDSADGKAAFWFRADQPLGATECLSGGVGGAAIYDQPPGRYLVAVDGPTAGPFVLEVDCGPQLDCSAPPDLACNQVVTGTTVGARSDSSFHACLPTRYSGPETAWAFTNPVEQVVSFVLDDAADARLDLLLLGACDESRCIAAGDQEVTRTLAPGDYVLVVDGREGAAAPYSITAACGLALEPVLLETTLSPGDCTTEHKTAWLTPAVPKLDVLFSVDVSGSFSAELVELPRQIDSIMAAIDTFAEDTAFGVSSISDYSSEESGTVPCPFTGANYGRAGFDYPYRLDLPITQDRAAVRAALDALVPLDGLDEAESYELALQQSVRDPATGWRPDARRVLVMFGDEKPHDCNVLACLGDTARFSDGISFGMDGLANTADDVRVLEALQEMRDAGITLVFLDSGGGLIQAGDGSRGFRTFEMWECLAGRTGGSVARLNDDGTPMGAPDLATVIMPMVRAGASWCDSLELRTTPGYEAWLQSVTPVHASIVRPYRAEFDLSICVPPGTPEGVHELEVEITCDGLALAAQRVRVVVTGGCAVAPPEVDRQSVRVTKSASRADVLVRWSPAAGATHENVYRGTLAAFDTTAHYDHGAIPGGCSAPLPFVDAGAALAQQPDVYYLVVAACAGAGGELEGPYGFGHDGRAPFARPDASVSPAGPCP